MFFHFSTPLNKLRWNVNTHPGTIRIPILGRHVESVRDVESKQIVHKAQVSKQLPDTKVESSTREPLQVAQNESFFSASCRTDVSQH